MKKLFFMMAMVATVTMFASCNSLGFSPIKLDLSGNIVDTWQRNRIWVDSTKAGAGITDTYFTKADAATFMIGTSRIRTITPPATDTVVFDSQAIYPALAHNPSPGGATYAYDSGSGKILMDRTPGFVTRIGAEDMTIEFWTGGINIDGAGAATPNATGPNVRNVWYFKRHTTW